MSLKISRILHAGYVFECEGTSIAFDPIFEVPFSRNCYPFPAVKFDHQQINKLNFSAVFISHFHDDHCSLESLIHLDRKTPIYMYCLHEELLGWIRELGFKEVYALKLNEPLKMGSIEIIPRRALDEKVDSLFHIKAAGLNVLNVVDSWIDYETLDLLKETAWDLVLWPFQTMRELEVLSPSRAETSNGKIPYELAQQLKELHPTFLVPSSCQFIQEPWSWYNHAFFPISYKGFAEQIANILPETQVVRIDPSVSFRMTKNEMKSSMPLAWMTAVGEQNVDYDYKPELRAPMTSEIAKNFPALTAEQKERVLEYCRHGIIKKFKSLDESEEVYFQKPRHWKLSIYDHEGKETPFNYLIENQNLALESSDQEKIEWLTEVSLYKLHSALESGESLTSMYMRINDRVFDEETEKAVAGADIIEDPLVRCLFTGAFGSYQYEQLLRIRQMMDKM